MFLQSSSVPGLSCDLLYIVVNLVPRVCLFAGYVPLHNPRTGILWERDCIVVKTSRQTSKPIDHSYFNRWIILGWYLLITDKNRQKATKTDKKADKYRQKSKQIPTTFLSVFVCLFVGICRLPFWQIPTKRPTIV